MEQRLHLLRFDGHLIGQAGKGRFQLAIHPVEFIGQILDLIAGSNVDRLMQFAAPDQLGRGL